MANHVEGRATLNFQKKEVLSRILNVWLSNPHLRLGQLLVNALSDPAIKTDIFQIEDYDLMALVEEFGKKVNPVIYPQITIQVMNKKNE